MNRICKNCGQYYINNCCNGNYKMCKFNNRIENIYCRLYQTGCALEGISKACNIQKIVKGIKNLMY